MAIWGDSSTIDDGTGQSGNTLFDGWNDRGTNAALALNATAWLAGDGSTGGTTAGTTSGTTSGTTGGTGCAAGQLLANPGFESGASSGWTATSGIINTSSKEPAHSGSYKLWLDGYGTTTTDTATQSVSIPAGCSASLSYWLHIDTAETTKTTVYDTLKVQVLNSSGTVLATLATYTNLNAATGYTQHTVDLSAYAGQTVTLKFNGTEDAQDQTSFVVDDTAISVG